MMESNDRSKWNADDEHAAAKSGRNGPSVALIVALALLVLAIIWFIQNGNTVTISFLFIDREVSVRIAIIIAIAVGVLLDRLVSYALRRRKRRKAEID